jgi:hypothetical protein
MTSATVRRRRRKQKGDRPRSSASTPPPDDSTTVQQANRLVSQLDKFLRYETPGQAQHGHESATVDELARHFAEHFNQHAWPATFNIRQENKYAEENIPFYKKRCILEASGTPWAQFFDLPDAADEEDISLEQKKLMDLGKDTDAEALELGQGVYVQTPVAILDVREYSDKSWRGVERKCKTPLTATGLYLEGLKPVGRHQTYLQLALHFADRLRDCTEISSLPRGFEHLTVHSFGGQLFGFK